MRATPLILIIEDNPASLDIMEARLTAHDYEIMTATDGAMGLNLAKEHLPDLILSDIMMPKMDGLEVCRRLRGDASIPFIPIILVTAKADSRDIVAGLEAGADDDNPVTLELSPLSAYVWRGLVLTDGARMLRTPTWHVFEMYRVHQEATGLPTEVESAAYALGDRRLDQHLELSFVGNAAEEQQITGAAFSRVRRAQLDDRRDVVDGPHDRRPADQDDADRRRGIRSVQHNRRIGAGRNGAQIENNFVTIGLNRRRDG